MSQNITDVGAKAIYYITVRGHGKRDLAIAKKIKN